MLHAISASDFKATCLDLLDRVAAGELEEIVVTKRGRPVGVLHPPKPSAVPADLFGCMRGSVTVPPSIDLTAPLDLDPFDAEGGTLQR